MRLQKVTCTTRKLVDHLIYHVNKRARIEKQYDNISVPKLSLPHERRSLPLRHQQELQRKKTETNWKYRTLYIYL